MSSEDYRAIVIRPSALRPHPNADKLSLITALHYQVIVGRNTSPTELLLFFEAGLQLSDKFAKANKLLREDGGMFEPNLRVKPIKLRGQRSDGFAIPITSLSSFGDVSGLVEGDEFASFNGVEICRKYESQQTKKARQAQQKVRSGVRVKLRSFPQHADTSNFRKKGRYIQPGSILYISEKLHGTSFRFGHVRTDRRRWQWAPTKVSNLVTSWLGHVYEYKHINGTRQVVLADPRENVQWRGGDPFRFRVTAPANGRLIRGEVVYGEIMGYRDNGKAIQSHSTDALPELKPIYGPRIDYLAGATEGEAKGWVYRIASVSDDGRQVEWSWPQVKNRAFELGFEVVPVVLGPIVYDGDFDALFRLVDEWVNGKSGSEALPSVVDSRHIREGAVVRAEAPDGSVRWWKHKSWAFLTLEGMAMERGQVDVEDVQKEEEPV